MSRDITRKQFDAACARYGFIRQMGMGYYDVGNGVWVSAWNAGDRLRDRLAYLIRESEKVAARVSP